MTAGEIITAYQNSREPPLTDSDLARVWKINRSNVFRIKKGEQMPGNRIWPNCQRNTPELYIELQRFYFGVSPTEVSLDAHQTRQSRLSKIWQAIKRIWRP
ncbi:hypothetical protein ES708_09198 [subsurface metagenome]